MKQENRYELCGWRGIRASEQGKKLSDQVNYYRRKLLKQPSLCKSELSRYGFKKNLGMPLVLNVENASATTATTEDAAVATTATIPTSTPIPIPKESSSTTMIPLEEQALDSLSSGSPSAGELRRADIFKVTPTESLRQSSQNHDSVPRKPMKTVVSKKTKKKNGRH